MPKKTSAKSNIVRTKSSEKKIVQKTDASKILALEEQLAQREAELAIINSIQTALASKMDFQGIIDSVGDKLGEIFRDGNVGIAFMDKARNVVTFPYVVENGKRLEYFELTLAGSSLMRHILKRRRPLVINSKFSERFDGTGAFNFPGKDQRDLKSWVSVPIFNGDEIIGGISLRNWQKENAYTESDVRLLQTVANSMSVALENARLFDEIQTRNREIAEALEQQTATSEVLSVMANSPTEVQPVFDAIIERATKLCGGTGGLAYWVRDGKIYLVSHYHGNPQAFQLLLSRYPRRYDESDTESDIVSVIRSRAILHMSDMKTDPRVRQANRDFAIRYGLGACLWIPLIKDDKGIGALVISRNETELFTDKQIALVETFASQAVIAIENVRLFNEAQEARSAAEQANKAKSTFLANMSHELRTPLNAIMGFTDIVRMKAEGVLPERQIENLNKVMSSSEHLLGLINTALDIAKIEAGRMDVIPAKFNLSGLADQCANIATPLLKPNVTLEKQVDDNVNLIYSDQDKIKQIILNLLSNAAKFTHEGRILLSVDKFNEENVGISVTDSGIGIGEEALGRVFEEFQQADTSTTRQYGGTGLGLAISRNLARLLGGDLTATSELGKGSTFTLTIPIQYGYKTASSSDPEPDSVQQTESHDHAVNESSDTL